MSKGVLSRMKSLAAQAGKTRQQIKEKSRKRRTEKRLKREEKIKLKTQELALKRKEMKQKAEIKRLDAELKRVQAGEQAERVEKARKAYNLVMYGSTKGKKK